MGISPALAWRGGGDDNWQNFQTETQGIIMKACTRLLITKLDP